MGKPLNYHTYYQVLRRSEIRMHELYENTEEFKLYAHGCRATFLNTIAGELPNNEPALLYCMDWKSLKSLHNYYDMRKADYNDESNLYASITNIIQQTEGNNEFHTIPGISFPQCSGTF